MRVELKVYVDDGYNMDMNTAIDELWKRFRLLVVVGKITLKSRVCELDYPHNNFNVSTAWEIKNQWRSEEEREERVCYDIYKDLSYHEYVGQASQFSKRQYDLIHIQDSLFIRPSHSSRKSTIISFQFSHLFTIVGKYSWIQHYYKIILFIKKLINKNK